MVVAFDVNTSGCSPNVPVMVDFKHVFKQFIQGKELINSPTVSPMTHEYILVIISSKWFIMTIAVRIEANRCKLSLVVTSSSVKLVESGLYMYDLSFTLPKQMSCVRARTQKICLALTKIWTNFVSKF